MQTHYTSLLTGIISLFISCQKNERAIHIPDYFPQENRIYFDTVCRETIELGSKFFFDKRLSRDSSISCASCHKPELAFTDGEERSIGLRGNHSRHNSSTLLNVGFSPTFMFDMRANNIEIQPMIPIQDTSEMNMTLQEIAYRFKDVIALQELSKKGYHRSIDGYVITHSLASFMKSLITSNSKYDESIKSGNRSLLSDNERKGEVIFRHKGQCNSCHTAPLFSNYQHYNLGIELPESKDIGKMGATHREEDRGRFKTPSLRNIGITFPYFHNGKIKTLEDAILFHVSKSRKTEDFTPVQLNLEERKNLILFLHTLTDNQYLKNRN